MKNITLLLALAFALALCNLTDRLKKAAQSNTNSGSPATSSNSSSTGAEPVERPAPTSAQKAAVAGGQTVTWDQQGISWTMPANWRKQDADSKTFSAGGGNTAFLSGNISAFDESFPAEASIKAMFESAKSRQKLGEVDEVRWLELDGLKGIEFREAKPEKADDIRRLQWQAYRKYKGQTQLVNLILSARGEGFNRNEDAFYGILYSTKVAH